LELQILYTQFQIVRLACGRHTLEASAFQITGLVIALIDAMAAAREG
jgi:hypothetical protein